MLVSEKGGRVGKASGEVKDVYERQDVRKF